MQNNHKCALVCIAKDEDNYIQEWIDYHLKLGFSDIYIWQNNWRSNVVKENENVHLRIIDGDFKQVECYNKAIDEIFNQYEWIAFFDVDEFLVGKPSSGFQKIDEFLSQEKYLNIPCLCINWRMFGDSGHNSIDKWNVLDRFIYSDDKLDETSKSIIHTKLTQNEVKFFFNPHCVSSWQFDPNLKFQLKCIGNNKAINNDNNDEPLELNHYRNKTYTELFIRHFSKPCVTDTIKYEDTLDEFNKNFNKLNRNSIENTYARDFYSSHAKKSNHLQ